jgi:hypothetical protein
LAIKTLRKSGMPAGECSIAPVDEAFRLRAREGAAAFLVAAALALALAWPSLRWPMVYDDLHQIRAYTATDVAAAFRGRSDPDGIETQGLRPLNLLFNHAQYALFGEDVAAHRLFLAALHAAYAAILATIARRFGLPLPFALLAMALAMCARYSVYHYVWLVEGHHYVQGLLFEAALFALLAGLRAASVGRLALSAALLLAGALIREDTLALVPVLAVLGYVSLGPTPARRSVVALAAYTAALLLAAAALLGYRARVAPQALAPGHDLMSFLVSVRRALNPMGLEHFDTATHALVLVWGALAPLLIFTLLVTRRSIEWRMPFVWLALAVAACAPAFTLRRDDLLLFPTAFVALFFASALESLSRGRPILRGAAVAALMTGILGGAYVSRVYAQNFHPYSARAVWWNGKFIYGSYSSRATIPPERREAMARQLATVGIRNEAQIKTRLRRMVADAIAQGRRTPRDDETVFFPRLPEEDF